MKTELQKHNRILVLIFCLTLTFFGCNNSNQSNLIFDRTIGKTYNEIKIIYGIPQVKEISTIKGLQGGELQYSTKMKLIEKGYSTAEKIMECHYRLREMQIVLWLLYDKKKKAWVTVKSVEYPTGYKF